MAENNSLVFPADKSTRFHFIVSESNGYQSREELTIDASAGALPGGTLLARLNGGTTWVGWGTAGTSSIAILGEDVDTTDGKARKRTGFVRNMEVQKAKLSFIGTPDAATQNTAFAALADRGVALR